MIRLVKDRHVIEALGKTRIVIEDGEVIDVGDIQVDYCPMFKDMHGVDKLNKEFIKKNIEFRIDDFGMCTPDRVIKMNDAVTVGISEILRTNVENGDIDCVVGACDGVGTLLMEDPAIIQGVGGRVSGLISTTPIDSLIKRLEDEGCIVLNPETAELDPLAGLKLAIEKGYKNIAITVIPGMIVKELRDYPVPDDVNVYIFVAHTTLCSDELAEVLFDNADIITACASKALFDYADEHKPYYYGKKIPIFCGTNDGRRFLDARLEYLGKPLTTNEPMDRSNNPSPLI